MFNTQKKPKTKEELCPINKIMKKINKDHMDKTRLKLDEKDIFEGDLPTDTKKKAKSKKKKKK